MNDKDIRWEQRLSNFKKALNKLNSAVRLSKERKLTELEQQGLIQAFKFTHELTWNVMKDYLYYQGNTLITGSRDATREAFNKGLIVDGEQWMEMINSRNQSTHTYNQETADEITGKIGDVYSELFIHFLMKMETLKSAS